MTDSLNVDLVRTNGRIDEAASTAAFQAALTRHIAEVELQTEQIEAAVSALFDQHMGKSIPMPTVGSMVATLLGAQPENHGVLAARTLDYVRANSQTTGSAKGGDLVQHPDSLFFISKGAGGGVYRRADRPAPEAK